MPNRARSCTACARFAARGEDDAFASVPRVPGSAYLATSPMGTKIGISTAMRKLLNRESNL